MITLKAAAVDWMPRCSICGKQVGGLLASEPSSQYVEFQAQCHGATATYLHAPNTDLDEVEREAATHAAVRAWDPFPLVTP